MRKIKLFLACLLMAVLSIGQMWATDEVVYTLTPVAGSDNGYATNEDIDITDGETTITWNVTGNATMIPWRIGGKNLSGVNREVYSKDAMSAAITKVELTVGTASSVTVNSLKLIVASDEDFSDVIDEVTKDFTASSTITFEPTSPATKWATGAYYKFVFKVTIGSNNKYVQFTEAKFYAEAAAPAFTITALSNDESKGTVSLTGSVITGSPKSGCRYASPAYTVTSGTATVAQSGNAFTVTPSSDCTVRINFEAIPQYTVTWDNNGSTSTSQVLEGNKPVFPATPTSCDATSKTFIGWATEAWTSKLANLTGKTVYTSASAMPDVDAAVTYYAVFAKSSGSAGNLFEWEGGTSSALTALENVTASGLGTDYAEGNAPYRVKFDTEGDYIVITTSGAIESVAVGVKMLGGGNTSHIYVQEAEDAESDFSAVETLTISGAQNDVLNLETENAFKADSRAVKLLFNKGSNVGVGPITIAGAASASDYMTTCAAPTCENLGTPVVNVTNKTYNSARLTWAAVDNADKYLVKFNGVDQEATENLYFDATGLEAEETYTYQVKALAEANQDDWCDGAFSAEANFTTDAAPTAHLTLIDINGTHASSGDYAVGTPFNLPTTAATCSKTFVGWDPDDKCATAPTYTKGQSFTFENTTSVTLYAVYADVTGGSSNTTNIAYSGVTTNMTGNNDAATFGLDADDWNVVGVQGGSAQNVGLNKDGSFRLYYHADGNSAIQIEAPQTVTSVALTFTEDTYNNAYVKVGENLVALEDGVYPINATSFEIGNANTSNVQVRISNIAVNFVTPGTPSNYSTTCAAAPEVIVDPEEVNVSAAAVAAGVIEAAYDNVDEENLSVALFNDQACTEAFDGGWLTASINGDKNIAYTIAENTTYVARTAYIKLTAPETSGAANPAVVVIPVEQAKKPAVFASLEDLVAAELASGTEVTVSFSNILITEVYTTKAGYRYGLYLNVKDKDGVNDIELFYNKQENSEQVPDSWVKNGYVSATNLVTTWTEYKGQWELAMQGATWSWENGDITYAAPKTVSSVVVSGEPGKKAYVDGEKFNPAGLTVTVNYTIGESDVIDAADADWVYETSDVMALNQTSIKVKATYNTVTSVNFYEVTDLTVNPISNKTIAQFIADEGGRCYLEGIVSGNINTTYGNFDLQDETGTIYVYGSDVFEDHGVAQGDKVKVIAEEYLLYKKQGNPDKDEALNVVFVSKVSAATIDIDDINMTEGEELLLSDIVATITPDAAQSATINYEVTEGTVVTISEGKIIASTEGVATITASIEAGEGYLSGSTTFTVTVSPAPVPFVGDYFVKVDDNSDLTAGEYLIVYEAGNVAFNGGLGTLDAVSNTVAVTFENGKIQGTEAVLAATFTIKLAGTIQSKSDYYIGRTGNSNGMNTSKDEAYTNAISIDGNGDAVILASGGAYLRYNSADNQKRFRYFQSSSYTSQKAIQLYKKENAEPVYETVRTELESNAYYTMCLDKAVTAVHGGSIWRVLSKAQNSSDIILEEVEGTLDAGRPYIFYATAATLEVAYNGAAVLDPITEGNNGLIGSFQKASITANASNYIIYNNELYYVNSGNVYVGEHRAYLNMGGVPDYSEPQQQQGAPRRRVTMAVHSEQVATGIDALNTSDAPVKVLINGQLFIIRGEKMFDAKGQLVK